jgi:hypothetical protein
VKGDWWEWSNRRRLRTQPSGATHQAHQNRPPDFAGNRAASLKSKSYVGQAVLVLVLVLEGKPWGNLEAMFRCERHPRRGVEVLSPFVTFPELRRTGSVATQG